MSVSDLSASSQNYLKAVWTLREWSDEPVTASTLAARTGVRLSSASDAVRKLTDRGLLSHSPYGSVELTAEGERLAVEMVRRHRLIEAFLVEALGYSSDEVHAEAEVLEHAVSDLLVERIDERLGRPERDPHGDPIPSESGRVLLPATILLADLGVGRRGLVERVSDSDPLLVRFLDERGIRFGAEVERVASPPFSDTIEVLAPASAEACSLGAAAARAVRVRPLGD
ncbi:metal-dependent transcriptional regulator [Actinomyces sp. B33]|uniref:metal-dependent transcriptional regulator n=1 Tax=Actinomyces sp. B33 TaxID=2942131 RepID=UPI0023407BEC|nr:metal-dependent transcriptional regulator [Actinomyces sp. B33]MDC4232822.1 metal-dependent transcriptional regulator [Actinomyces sp. B33]